ncbi:MAG TPA: TonB-dependent receptor [Bryobacteraceae bacterium]|nr:TonB-dependent receptor [Bryobacteraceae bacterium]
MTRSTLWKLCLFLAISGAALAQLYTGSVTGVISDPSGGMIPNAQVTLTDEQKGFAFNATADAAGRYVLRGIPPGMYKISVQAPGFDTRTQSGIRLDVNQNLTLDFSLQLGTTTQTVSIIGEAPLLSTEDAVTGQDINRKMINDLPLLGRGVLDLAFLTPGITQVDTQCSGCTANNFISNGSRNATADVLMDGVTTTNFEQNSGIQVPTYTPSVDAVEEFRVQQSSFSAEFGFSGATVVNLVTRSGTNQFHGSLYEFLRNSKLDANNWFNNASGVPIPGLKQNNFGGTFGGPIIKNKTFFFFDYEGTRLRSLSTQTLGVPSAAERQGNFGELCSYYGGSFDSSGRCSSDDGQLWDPYSATYDPNQGGPVRSTFIPFNNLANYQSPGSPALAGTAFQPPPTPGNLINPVAQKLMQYYPMPNVAVGTSAYNPYNNWIGSGSNRSNNDQFDIKIDHRFSDKDLFSAKYSQQWNTGHGFNCFGNLADPCSNGPTTGSAHLVALNHTHTFSPTLLLTASYGLTRGAAWSKGIQADYKNLDPVSLLGLPSYITASGFPNIPAIDLSSQYAQAGASLGSQPWGYLREGQETHHLLATVNWVKGSHEIKFGGEGRMHRINFVQPGTPAGYFAFDPSGSSEFPSSGGGDAMASFMMGVGGINSWGQYEIPNFVSTQSFQYGGFIQDNWKTSRKLTLNIGVRYDISLPRTERYNRMNWFDPTVVSPIQVPGLPQLHGAEVFASPHDRQNYAIDPNDWQPRFGFAYQAFKNTVLRGGYGIFYSTTRSGAAGTGPLGYQGYDQTTNWIPLLNSGSDLYNGAVPYATLSNPFPTGVKFPPGSSLGMLNDIGVGAAGPVKLSAYAKNPYEQTWSFGIQQQLPWSMLLDTNYIGKKGTHLYFGGAGQLDYLGPQIEHYSADQLAALHTYVANPFYGVITDPNSPLSQPTVQAYQLQLPYPQYTGVSGDSPPFANSIYNALQVRVEKRFSSGLQFLFTYVYSKSIDEASSTDGSVTWLGGITSLQDPNNRNLERAVSTWDIPQVVQFSYDYELPIGKGKRFGNNMHPVLNAVIGGWQTNGIWRFDNGRPIIPLLSDGQSLPTYGAQRPNLVATLKRASGSTNQILGQYFANPDALVTPDPFTLGTAPRTITSVRQPGAANADLSLFKNFPFPWREGMYLQYRFEAFNALNHPQFCGPNTTVDSGNFGQISCTANSPREVQMALKFYW